MAGGQERLLRRRIKSIQSTQKITRAQELIAASRIASVPQVHVWHAAIAAQVGQMDESRAATAVVLNLDPEFTISKFLDLLRLAEKKDADRLAAALRKAGLPE